MLRAEYLIRSVDALSPAMTTREALAVLKPLMADEHSAAGQAVYALVAQLTKERMKRARAAAEWQAKRKGVPFVPPRHGECRMYVGGCRCELCRAANTAKENVRRAANRERERARMRAYNARPEVRARTREQARARYASDENYRNALKAYHNAYRNRPDVNQRRNERRRLLYRSSRFDPALSLGEPPSTNAVDPVGQKGEEDATRVV